MSTRSVIARPCEGPEGSWEGVYQHSDGYPRWTGAKLWAFCQPDGVFSPTDQGFGGPPEHVYVDVPSPFHGNLFLLLEKAIDAHPGGWSSFPDDPYPDGDMRYRDTDGLRARATETIEFVYIIHPLRRTMKILTSWSTAPNYRWRRLAEFDLDGPEPDWRIVEAYAGVPIDAFEQMNILACGVRK